MWTLNAFHCTLTVKLAERAEKGGIWRHREHINLDCTVQCGAQACRAMMPSGCAFSVYKQQRLLCVQATT